MFFNSAGERDLAGDYMGKTMQMRLIVSRSIISGRLILALSWCPELGEAEKHLADILCFSSRLSAEYAGFHAVFLETRFEPMHQCSVKGFLHKHMSLSTLQFLEPYSKL